MNRVDRLIIKARRSVGAELIYAIVERYGEQWRALVHLKYKGAVEVRESLHATDEMAIDHIRATAKIFPNSRDLTILVDDMPG